jgi:hypothetical protein
VAVLRSEKSQSENRLCRKNTAEKTRAEIAHAEITSPEIATADIPCPEIVSRRTLCDRRRFDSRLRTRDGTIEFWLTDDSSTFSAK